MRYTIVAFKFFTTARFVNFDDKVYDVLLKVSCEKAAVFSFAELCRNRAHREAKATDSLHIYVRTPHAGGMFGEL